jgi:hypothetical protein
MGGTIGLALSASKLVALSSLLDQFPRTYYPLPGVNDVRTLISLVFNALFLRVPDDVHKAMSNSAFTIGKHEWEFGLSPIAFVILCLGTFQVLTKKSRNSDIPIPPESKKAILVAGLITILLTPLLLNWYSPSWNQLLKSLPFISTSSNLIRWVLIYIPIICLACALTLDSMTGTIKKKTWAIIGVSTTVLWSFIEDKRFYEQNYDPKPIEAAWQQAYITGLARPVTDITNFSPSGGGPNDGIAYGVSSIGCYEPTMGYRLEKMPVGSLHQAPVFTARNSLINIKNPACYAYPEENHCRPGDHFTVDNISNAESFVRYLPFTFELSRKQRIANTVTNVSLWLAISILTLHLILATGFFAQEERKFRC